MTSHRNVAGMLVAAALASTACGEFHQELDAKFGDQHFKSAIALIHLHKVRYGSYPDELSELRFTGDWDQIWMSSVEYRKLADGYELDLVKG